MNEVADDLQQICGFLPDVSRENYGIYVLDSRFADSEGFAFFVDFFR